jgi:hypothetical protein
MVVDPWIRSGLVVPPNHLGDRGGSVRSLFILPVQIQNRFAIEVLPVSFCTARDLGSLARDAGSANQTQLGGPSSSSRHGIDHPNCDQQSFMGPERTGVVSGRNSTKTDLAVEERIEWQLNLP